MREMNAARHLGAAGSGEVEWLRGLCWLGVVGGEGVGEGLLDRGGLYMQGAVDLGAVDDERLGELLLHFEQFTHGGDGERAVNRSRTGGT
jgi:hypothetical protein